VGQLQRLAGANVAGQVNSPQILNRSMKERPKAKAQTTFGKHRFMLQAKIHGATLTGIELHYEGSIAVDRLNRPSSK
jgi:hypothetical protein